MKILSKKNENIGPHKWKQMFIALFILASNWNNPKYQQQMNEPTEECIQWITA